MRSHDIKPHSHRRHQKAERKDPSEERCLGENVELELPSGRLRGSRVCKREGGNVTNRWIEVGDEGVPEKTQQKGLSGP